MAATLSLPIIDLSSPHRLSTPNSIRQACVEYGFFYLVNRGVDTEIVSKVFDQSGKFFSLPVQRKLDLARKEYRSYTPLYSETLDPTSLSNGDPKETYYIGPIEDTSIAHLNQWPSEELLPNWRPTMESLYWKLMDLWPVYLLRTLFLHLFIVSLCALCGYMLKERMAEPEHSYRLMHGCWKKSAALIAMPLNLEEDYFEKIGALNKAAAFLRLLHYPVLSAVLLVGTGFSNRLSCGSDEQICGASPHSDYGMITLLMTEGVPGLQGLNSEHWRNDGEVNKLFIQVSIIQRVFSSVFESTLHRVMPTGKERYSVAFFFDPASDCVVECFESCCSESSPPRFPPIRSGDYLNERFRLTYGS
uniref:Fe2OG dioxygenase domain-containing protein n=1 Tax=Glycine max TaxID=3847 RepID=A0A0R0FCP5_SOYBN